MIFEGEGNARIFEEEIRGIKLKTPLYVSSISGRKADLRSMAQRLNNISLPQKIYMLSAFDTKTLDQQSVDTFEAYSEKNLVYLDNGAYESYYEKIPWDFSDYFDGLNRIGFDILTAFDRIPPEYETSTIAEMKSEFLATNKLVKGGRKTLVLHGTRDDKFDDLKGLIIELKNEFDILGIPEAMCGRGTEGLPTIRNLRAFMDKEGIIKPIHIFGCGKLAFILQFVEAGADIFDANSWMFNIYNTSKLFSKDMTKEKFRFCTCESCQSQQFRSSWLKRKYSHNFLAIKNAMDLIRQSIIDNRLLSLINQIKD
jgi:hypothetical protein